MRLKSTPFTLIQSGEKTVECRLFDEKRQKIQLGDSIIFSLRSDEAKKITVNVVGLLRYGTFAEMFARNDPQKFGGKTASELTEALLKYYALDEQKKDGVLGVEFELAGGGSALS